MRGRVRIIQVHLGFADGGMALIDINSSVPVGDDYYSLSLIGADGSAYVAAHEFVFHHTVKTYCCLIHLDERCSSAILLKGETPERRLARKCCRE